MRIHPFSIAVALLACASVAGAAELRFGELPAGSMSVSEVRDVTAEICRDHLFDPASVRARLPAGYRLTTAAEAATKDPALESLPARAAGSADTTS